MFTRRAKLTLVALVLLTMAVVAVVWLGGEPSYEGKTLSAWADLGIAATSGPEWRTNDLLLASNAVTRLGARAAPWVMRWTRQNRSVFNSVRRQWNQYVPQNWEIDQVPDESGGRGRFVAACIPDQLVRYKAEMVRRVQRGDFSGSTLLGFLGPSALPEAVTLLGDTQEPVKRAGLNLVLRTGTNALSVLPELREQLRAETNRVFRDSLLLALVAIGDRSPDLVRIAGPAFTAEQPEERQALTLSRVLRISGADGLPWLLAGLTNVHRPTRMAAAAVLANNETRMPRFLRFGAAGPDTGAGSIGGRPRSGLVPGGAGQPGPGPGGPGFWSSNPDALLRSAITNLMTMTEPSARQTGLGLATTQLQTTNGLRKEIDVSDEVLRASVARLVGDPVPEIAIEARKILEQTPP